ESLRRTLTERETWFWSRSRGRLWHKGESSGNTQRVIAMSADCDLDALRVLVEPRGPACHTGARSCFHHRLDAPEGDADEGTPDAARASLGAVLERLYTLIEGRRRERPEGSYTTYLFDEGLDKILKKVGEESAETIVAAKNGVSAPLVAEISDLVYHLLVLMVERGVKPSDVAAELEARRGAAGGAEGES
ncbi:MAG TPA: bifunctional phosphoribosyl-AMP cyclohydrolase/phosphoribosyl-ATP diphosphatase HisIE, partial [Pyrinomonadaceae bacterium]|nr:bifunctional phosphoribosyl-AMP cyclohydrolase/phosphoribosyl-ATP diphosphatase HisIE [Pyrinomonadaceae bacterium]